MAFVMPPAFEWGAIEAFRTEAGYEFPFEPFDATPGGTNLGRIEWHLELVRKGRGAHLEALVLWATQTRDDRYVGRLFRLPVQADLVTRGTSDGRSDFLTRVWRVGYCDVHRHAILSAYPADEHRRLVAHVWSGISVDLEFRS